MRLEAAADHLCPRGRGASRGAPRRCPMAFPGSALLGVRVPPTVLGLPPGCTAPEPLPTQPAAGWAGGPCAWWPRSDSDGGAGERRSAACRIKLGASKLKIHIYFNRSGCSEGDEREGR